MLAVCSLSNSQCVTAIINAECFVFTAVLILASLGLLIDVNERNRLLLAAQRSQPVMRLNFNENNELTH